LRMAGIESMYAKLRSRAMGRFSLRDDFEDLRLRDDFLGSAAGAAAADHPEAATGKKVGSCAEASALAEARTDFGAASEELSSAGAFAPTAAPLLLAFSLTAFFFFFFCGKLFAEPLGGFFEGAATIGDDLLCGDGRPCA
jgi:hypothetical protein